MKQTFSRRWLPAALLALCLAVSAACAAHPAPAKERLVGSWEHSTEASVIGFGAEGEQTTPVTIRYVFREDGTGEQVIEHAIGTSMDGTPMLSASLEHFHYRTEKDQLILEYNHTGSTAPYTFLLEGDSLTLDGLGVSFTLRRAS